MKKIGFTNRVPDNFYWFNQPEKYHFAEGLVISKKKFAIKTDPGEKHINY
ncbi:MAG: hypothetical protein ACOCQS_01705 [Bacillota bacterium]